MEDIAHRQRFKYSSLKRTEDVRFAAHILCIASVGGVDISRKTQKQAEFHRDIWI